MFFYIKTSLTEPRLINRLEPVPVLAHSRTFKTTGNGGDSGGADVTRRNGKAVGRHPDSFDRLSGEAGRSIAIAAVQS